MIKIDYQALREAAQNAKDLGGIKNYKRGEQAVAEFESLITPHIVLALLDERERNQQYIKRRDQENEMMVDAMHAAIALTSVGIDLDDYDECVLRLHEWGALPDYCIALYVDFVHGIVSKNKLLDFGYINGAPVWTLRDELEAAKSKLNEQREYYEGVIADGSKRIAELEKSEEQLINERDHAEYALADMYFAATGNRPEWSNWFGFSDAVDAVVDRIADLEAKQPSPVVPEEMYWQDAPVEGSSKAAAYATGCNACRADMLQGDEPVSNHEELPLDYLQGQKDGLEWAAQLAEANHPQTCDWLYDDPVELAKAIRKGPDMPEAAGNSPVTPDGWISCSERMPAQDDWILIYSKHGEYMAGQVQGEYVELSDGTLSWLGNALYWMPLPEPPQEAK
ncbi:TPA: ead/Ea22-like family protein [Escherichia coli]